MSSFPALARIRENAFCWRGTACVIVCVMGGTSRGFPRLSVTSPQLSPFRRTRELFFENPRCVVRLASGSDRLTFAGDAVFQVGFEHPDWYNGFEHDPEEAASVRISLLR
jgi:hypothetical protein